jgi:hypothetical protein
MQTNIVEILSGMKSFLDEGLKNREKYLNRASDFTRNRLLTFERLCLFMLSNSRRSLSLELDEFYLEHQEWPCTKSAFSQARYRIKSDFFKDWSRQFVNLIYNKQQRELSKWKDFYLKGVDGSTLYLFDEQDVLKEFGGTSNQHGQVGMGRAGFQIDLLNDYCSAAYLGPYKTGERHFANLFLNESTPSDLLIYDRNFISFELIYKHIQAGVPFLMRSAITFNKVVERFFNSKRKQATEHFLINVDALKLLTKEGFDVNGNTRLKVRLIRIELDNGETEILVTNLLDRKKYPHNCFKELYSKRWNCETQIEKFKNKLQLEIFTGHKPQAIYQDFFTTIIVANLHSFIVRSCDKQLQKINKNRQQMVRLNQNISIGLLKKRLVILFENNSPKQILKVLKSLFLRHLQPIRPGRKFLREPSRKRQYGKYQTFTNYRRAF